MVLNRKLSAKKRVTMSSSPMPANGHLLDNKLDNASASCVREASSYEIVKKWCNENNCDIYIYSGSIGSFDKNVYISERFINLIVENPDKKENCMLFLTSYGGDADWAYKISATLKKFYKNYDVVVCGFCKSAATLIALGAKTLFFSPKGELGPLDVQTRKKDDLFSRQSPLDVFQSKDMISSWASDFCKKFFFDMLDSGGGIISIEAASLIANKLSESLFSPIMSKINPLEVGEIYRAMNVADAYGNIIKSNNVKDGTLAKLVVSYPSHSFVIDVTQAKVLFHSVEDLTEIQKLIYNISKGFKHNVLERPCSNAAGFVDLALNVLQQQETKA